MRVFVRGGVIYSLMPLLYITYRRAEVNQAVVLKGEFCGFYRNMFFLPPTRSGLRGHPNNVLQGARHRRRRRLVRVVKYWNKFLVSVIIAPSVTGSKKTLENVWK